MTVVWFLLMLLVLILVHEVGHFASAKAFGVRVEEFGIFLPPRLVYFRHGETIYSLNLLPLGGFTRMTGEVDPSETPKPSPDRVILPPPAPGKKPHTTLASRSIAVRIVVLGAGSIMNLLLPFVLLSVALMMPHLTSVDTGDVIVDAVEPGSPADLAGIKAGDYIVSINGQSVNSDRRYSGLIAQNLGKPVTVGIRKAGGSMSGPTTFSPTIKVTVVSADGSVHIASVKVGSTVQAGEISFTGVLKGNEVSPAGIVMTPRADSLPTIGIVVTAVAPPGGVLVDSVQAGSSAQLAGIVAGDTIVSVNGVNGTQISSTEALTQAVAANVGSDMKLQVRHRDGRPGELVVRVYLDPPPTGVSIATVKSESLPFWEAIPQSAPAYWDMLLLFKYGIVATIRGTVPFQVAGPVGIAQATGRVAQLGVGPLLRFAAFISINLGIVNILPLPALDGGRIFFVLLEWIRRGKRVSPKTENLVHAIGFVLLLTLMFLATWGDVSRIISGKSLGP